MRILALAAVGVALAGCAQASPEERQRLIDNNVALFAPAVEGLAVGASYGYATRYDHGYRDYHDYRPPPSVTHHEPPPPPVMFQGPTYCHPGIGGRGTVCN